MGAGGWIGAGIAGAIALYVIAVYNRLIVLRNRGRNAYAQIDVQLKRRYDLIPNLVEAVKGYMAHERQTLEAVINARARAMTASDAASKRPGELQVMAALASAEGALSGALSKLLVSVEAYPQLKSSENVLALQEELVSTENRIGFARQAYNDAVMDYNIKRETFPEVVVASALGLAPAQQLQSTEGAEERRAPRAAIT
jgi:LemA protein